MKQHYFGVTAPTPTKADQTVFTGIGGAKDRTTMLRCANVADLRKCKLSVTG